MKQFLLPGPLDFDGRITLGGKDFHYLSTVRRVKLGDTVLCRHPSMVIAIELKVVALGADSLILEAETQDAKPTGDEPISQAIMGFDLHLVACLPKGAKTDQVVHQAAEAGLRSLRFVESDHCVATIKDGGNNKLERWQRIAREAFQQSGNALPTEILPPLSLDGWIDHVWAPSTKNPGQLGLFCHEKRLAQASLHQYCSHHPQQVFLIVGPEGGLSARETGLLSQAGLLPVFLGPRVLRAETAALYSIAAVQMTLLEADTWQIKKP